MAISTFPGSSSDNAWTPAIALSGTGPNDMESVHFRSISIGRSAARSTTLPPDFIDFLCECPSPSVNGNGLLVQVDFETVETLVDELLRSSIVNDHQQTHSRLLEKHINSGFVKAITTLFQAQEPMGTKLNHRLLLRSILPIYLAAGQGKLGTSLRDTFALLRNTYSVSELIRLTRSSDLSDWVAALSPDEDPLLRLESTFQISVGHMASSFWTHAITSKSKTANVSQQSLERLNTNIGTDKRNVGWWSLACQIENQDQKIHVPAEVALGFVDWNRLLDHWHRLESVLSGQKMAKVKPAPASISAPENKATAEKPATKVKLNDRRFVEIRSVNDPQLSSNLERMLTDARTNQAELSLLVVKRLDAQGSEVSAAIQNWQSRFIKFIDEFGASANARGFISDQGDLSLVYEDVERTEVAQWIRECFNKLSQTQVDAKLATVSALPLVAGVASVVAPSRTFKIEQLIQAAVRCLDGAAKQGAGAVKTIEVY